MQKILAIFNTASLVLLISACKPSPNRPNFLGKKSPGEVDGKDQNPEASEVGEKTDLENGSGKDPVKDKKSQAEAVDTILSGDDDSCSGKPRGFGRKSLRLLTNAEFSNSLKDILKTADNPSGRLPPESKVDGFPNNIDNNRVSPDHLSAYMDVAISMAESVKPSLRTLVGCAEDAGASCGQKVVDILGPKLFRRPLTAEEKTFALSIYQKGAAVSPKEGMTLLIASLITSPNFLYRSEIGDATGKLDGYEIAGALSYFFWGTVPDDALVANAANGKLLTEDGLKAEALRLLASPKSRFVMDEFSRGWLESEKILGTSKDPAIAAPLTMGILKAMYAEANDTFDFLMRQPNGTFESLVSSDFTIGSPELATFYGGQSAVDGGVNKIKFGTTGKKGLVTLGAVMASHARSDESHPIKRGDFVLQKMFCFVPPPTPEGLEVLIPPKDPSLTTRQRFAKHSSVPGCAGCHIKLDGVGFGLEDYDTLGRFREKDANGKPVDASGVVIDTKGKKSIFNGGGELSDEIAKSAEAKRCYTIHWYRYAHGRSVSSADSDVCATRDLAVKFADGKIPLNELLIKIITDSSYTKRGE